MAASSDDKGLHPRSEEADTTKPDEAAASGGGGVTVFGKRDDGVEAKAGDHDAVVAETFGARARAAAKDGRRCARRC